MWPYESNPVAKLGCSLLALIALAGICALWATVWWLWALLGTVVLAPTSAVASIEAVFR